MRQNDIRGRGKRRFRVSTTDSNHALPIAPNLLARNFTVAAANTVWTGDMTYILTGEGWLYLAVVLDLFSRRIVGWSMGEAIDSELACRALDMAWFSRSLAPGLIFHSDRGSQYATVEGGTRPFIREYMDKGYISDPDIPNPVVETKGKASVTKTLEYAYDDYSVALLAKELGDHPHSRS